VDVRTLPVGLIQQNCSLARVDAQATQAILIDPGDEAEMLTRVIEELGVSVEAILLTHTHFDHVGAVAPMARQTGAPVYCPVIEVPILRDLPQWTPPGFGPYEGYEPEHTVAGGERLQIAGLNIEVLFAPGHSPGHVVYSIPEHELAFSGDVLFQGSVGRTDLPGGDWETLLASIASLLEVLPDSTRLHPGHMGLTTVGAERATNPFLAELRDQNPAARG
jgi:hydroxyacylglutathione hydrolase